jgi:hypothetical protein
MGNRNENNDKQSILLLKIMTIVFFVSVMGVIIIYLYPELHRNYLFTMFFSLGATSLGTILGTYARLKKQFQIPRIVLFQIVIICLSCITLSLIIFFILRSKGFLEILLINLAGLVISIWLLIKKFKA